MESTSHSYIFILLLVIFLFGIFIGVHNPHFKNGHIRPPGIRLPRPDPRFPDRIPYRLWIYYYIVAYSIS